MKMRQKDSTRIIYHELNIVIDVRKIDIFYENVIILVVLVVVEEDILQRIVHYYILIMYNLF